MSKLFIKASPARLFIKCALPSIVSMAFISFYYVIDGIFIGKYLGSDALAAFGLIIPFVVMSFALADMIALGSAVQISFKLSLGKIKLARGIFTSCIVLIFAISCVVGLLEFFLAPFLIANLDTSDEIKALCKESMQIFAIFAPFTMLSFALDNYLRICAKNSYAMMINILIALCNIFFDYLFIVELELGLKGAALATCLGLMIGGILGIAPFLFSKLELKFTGLFLPKKLLKNIIFNGSSEFFNNVSGSLYAVFANLVLLELAGAKAVAAFSLISYIDNFINALIIAIGDGLQAALSFNYARKNLARLKAIIKMMFFIASILCVVAVIMLTNFSEFFVSFFVMKEDSEFLKFSAFALLLFAFNYLFSWFNVLTGSILTAFNQPKYSLILSSLQNLIIPLCFLLLLPLFLSVNGVWLAPLMSEICVLFLAIFLLRKILKF